MANIIERSETARKVETIAENQGEVMKVLSSVKTQLAVFDERQQHAARDSEKHGKQLDTLQRGLGLDRRLEDKSFRILVVDDSEPDRVLTEIAFRRVKGVTDVVGAESLEAAARIRGGFDFVALDLSMPGMDGVETVEECKRLLPGLPIVVVSGQTGPPNLGVQLHVAGADGYLAKDDLTRHEIERVLRDFD